MKKIKLMRILFTLLRNVLLEMESKILLYEKKGTFPVKSVSFFYKCFINSSKVQSRK